MRRRMYICALLSAPLLFSIVVSSPLYGQEEEGEDSPAPGWRFEFRRKYEMFRDYGHDWRLSGLFGLNPEEGIQFGGGPILYEFGFRSFPYVYRMQLTGEVAIARARFRLVYSLLMPALADGMSFDLLAHASELEVANFYGFGNDSPRDEARENQDFYRVASREFLIHPTIYRKVSRHGFVGFGASYKHFRIRQKENRYYNQLALDSLGDNRSQLGAGVMLRVDFRDNEYAPHSGVFLEIEGWNFIDPGGRRRPFQRIKGEGRFYLGDTLFTDIMLALRMGGERVFGSFPFYESAFLGGSGSLRGFQAQRFAGDAALFGSAELRVALMRVKMIIPTEVGILALADAGRVWVDGSSPGRWHGDVGGGLWLAPLRRDFLLSLLVAGSVDGVFFRAILGFEF